MSPWNHGPSPLERRGEGGGRAEVRPPDVPVFSLVDRFGEGRAMEDARRALEDLAEEVAADAAGLWSVG